MYKFQRSLKGLKDKIKKLNKEEFGNIFSYKKNVGKIPLGNLDGRDE